MDRGWGFLPTWPTIREYLYLIPAAAVFLVLFGAMVYGWRKYRAHR